MVQPESKLFEALFLALILTFAKERGVGGRVDPNPKTFESLFWVNLDIMNIFFRHFFRPKKKFLVGVQENGGGGGEGLRRF